MLAECLGWAVCEDETVWAFQIRALSRSSRYPNRKPTPSTCYPESLGRAYVQPFLIAFRTNRRNPLPTMSG